MDPSKISFLQSVLKYSTSCVDDSQKTESKNSENVKLSSREMSPERKVWLENALGSMSINPIDEMKKCIAVIDNQNEPESRKIEAIETLRDWCEDINFAIDFQKLKGYDLIKNMCTSDSSEIRALSCELVAAVAQNNPICQETLIDAGILTLMLNKLDKDDNEVKIKALYALSCITRDNEIGQTKLLENDALDILINSLSFPVEKLQIKCCFLFASLCNNLLIKNKLTEKLLIDKLINLFCQLNSTISEYVLSAIYKLIQDNILCIKQINKTIYDNFKQTLKDRIKAIKDDSKLTEEIETAESILLLLN